MSATSAVIYCQSIWSDLSLLPACVAVLFVFAVLAFMGITDSAAVATAMFALHVGTMTILVLACAVVVLKDGGHLMWKNW